MISNVLTSKYYDLKIFEWYCDKFDSDHELLHLVTLSSVKRMALHTPAYLARYVVRYVFIINVRLFTNKSKPNL